MKRWDKGGAVVRALASYQCGPGSNPCVLAASMSSVASNLFCFKCAPKQYAVVHSERKIVHGPFHRKQSSSGLSAKSAYLDEYVLLVHGPAGV